MACAAILIYRARIFAASGWWFMCWCTGGGIPGREISFSDELVGCWSPADVLQIDPAALIQPCSSLTSFSMSEMLAFAVIVASEVEGSSWSLERFVDWASSMPRPELERSSAAAVLRDIWVQMLLFKLPHLALWRAWLLGECWAKGDA